MAPSSLIDASTYTPVPTKSVTLPRTLLLAPPSLSSHPESLDRILEAHSRQTTDIQMLDRLFLSLVQLPPATYTTIIILTDADGTRSESRSLLSSVAITQLVAALKLGGTLRSQDGTFASKAEPAERREAILAGLIVSDDGVMKPDYDTTATIPLGLGRNRGSQITSNNGSVSNGTTTSASAATGIASTTSPAGTGVTSVNISDHRYNGPAGVGFVDFSDDFDAVEEEGSDDELIDEDTLLEESDFSRPVIQPPECRPVPGKRRRACKDCSCGLAQKLEAEDAAKRVEADQGLAKLKASDLAEVDFTVQGKVGSCGNCALGDAFRCDGCPYVGLPAFKPGEEVTLGVGDEGTV